MILTPNFDLIKYTWRFINVAWWHFWSGSYITTVIIDMNEHNMLTEEINVYTIYINFTRVLHTITTLKNIRLDLLNVNK